MSFEAYRVAVRLSLIENVSTGIMGISRALAGAHGDVGKLQARLNSLKLPMLASGALMGAGAFGLHMLKGPLDEAVKYQNELGKLATQGVGDAQLRQADKFAKAHTIIGQSYTDTLKMLAESNSVLRNMDEAMAVTPLLLKMKTGIETVMATNGQGGGHGAAAEQMFMQALKTTELRGALIDPATGKFSEERFKNALDFMTKAYTASGGLVKPTEYLNMIKTGGIAAKSLSDQAFYFGLMHMAQESGGSRVGTGLMSAFQNMYMGRTTQQVAEEMNKMGLFDKDKLHYGKTGHLTKIDAGSLKDAELFRTDQFRYMNEVMLPMLRARGVQDGEAMKMEIAKLFSNRVAGSQWVTMYMERANIQKHMDAAKDAMGIDQLYAQSQKQYSGQMQNLSKSWESLMMVLGEKLLPMAVGALQMLNPLLAKTVTFLRQHGTITKGLVIGLAGLSAAAVVVGSLGMLGVALRTIGLFMNGNLISIGIRAVGMALSFLGRALLMNPIGLVITGIVTAIYLLYTHWGKVKAWLVHAGQWVQKFWYLLGPIGLMVKGITTFGSMLLSVWTKLKTYLPDWMLPTSSATPINSVKTAKQAVNVSVHNTVDYHGVASRVTHEQAKMAERAQPGSSGYDGGMGAYSPTMAGAGA